MFGQEQDRVRQTHEGQTVGRQVGARFEWDPVSKTIRRVGGRDPDSNNLSFTKEDMGFSYSITRGEES